MLEEILQKGFLTIKNMILNLIRLISAVFLWQLSSFLLLAKSHIAFICDSDFYNLRIVVYGIERHTGLVNIPLVPDIFYFEPLVPRTVATT